MGKQYFNILNLILSTLHQALTGQGGTKYVHIIYYVVQHTKGEIFFTQAIKQMQPINDFSKPIVLNL